MAEFEQLSTPARNPPEAPALQAAAVAPEAPREHDENEAWPVAVNMAARDRKIRSVLRIEAAGSGMLSDLAILVEKVARDQEATMDQVHAFLTEKVQSRQPPSLTKADVSSARIHFVGRKPTTGPRGHGGGSIKRKTPPVSEGSEPAGKRVCQNDDNGNQIARPPGAAVNLMPAIADHKYSNLDLYGSARVFHKHIIDDVQNMNEKRARKDNDRNTLQISYERQLQSYRQLIDLHNTAQDVVASTVEELNNLYADNERLAIFQGSLNNAASEPIDVPSDPVVGIQNQLRDEVEANARKVHETEMVLTAARLDVQQSENALRAGLANERATKDRLNQLKAASDDLATQTRHADWMRILVENGPSAFATIEKALEANNIELGAIMAQIPAARANSPRLPPDFE
ncbi:hypothetical protein ACHAP7_005232 [Fusarium lateritium]